MGRRDWDPLLRDLDARRDAATRMGGPERLERQRAGGRLDARARVARLLDPGTFVELGTLAGSVQRGVTPPVPADGFVAGHGLVDGRPVCVGAEDFTVMAGSIGPGGAAKRQRLVELAAQERVPLVVALEGSGDRAANAYEPRGRAPNDLQSLARLSGLVPTVAVVMGPSAGHGALGAALTDLVVMVEGAAMFSAGPPLVKAATGEDVDRDELGGAAMHTVVSGVAHNVVPDDAAALDLVRAYLAYLPSNAWQRPPWVDTGDTGTRDVDQLLDVVPADPRRAYDVRPVLEVVMDAGTVLEVQPAFGRAVVTALARLGGSPVAIVANQPAIGHGALDADAADKSAHFLDLADAFHLPVVFVADSVGVRPGLDAERAGTLRRVARMLAAQARVRSPKLHVTLRRAYGLASGPMATLPFDAQTVSVAFPSARLGPLPAETGAVAAGREPDVGALLDHGELGGAYSEADALTYDEVIRPGELRDTLLAGLRLSAARETTPVGPAAHHGVRP